MPTRRTPLSVILIVAIILVLALGVGSLATAAQDATPEAAPEGTTARPAHIHSGTCDTLGDVVFPVNDVMTVEGDTSQSQDASVQSVTRVEVAIEELLAAEYAINVHESAENIDVYIACGEITGEPVDGQLSIQLDELNDSGLSGEALLEDAGDDITTVSITLTEAQTGNLATPAPDLAASGDAFQPGTVIVTTTESLRVRNEPTTAAEALISLPEGSQLEVISGPTEAEGFIWYEVEVVDSDEAITGWAATGADFVDPVE